jgi:hypothetical protein
MAGLSRSVPAYSTLVSPLPMIVRRRCMYYLKSTSREWVRNESERLIYLRA